MKKQILVVLLALVMVFSMVSLIACVDPEEPATYTLTYAAGEGSGTAPAASTHEEGAEITLAANTFTAPEGKEFDGWLVEGAKKAAGDKITMPAKDVTATAQWKAKQEPQPEDPSITLYFYNVDGWDSVYAYAWTGAGSTAADWLLGAWSGTKTTAVAGHDNWVQIELKADIEEIEVKIIFNNGSGKQTGDMMIEDAVKVYFSKNGAYASFDEAEAATEPEPEKPETTLYYYNSEVWDEVYAYAYVGSDKPLGNWPGTAMTEVADHEDWYEIVIEADLDNDGITIIFNGGNDQPQTANLPIEDSTNVYFIYVAQGATAEDYAYNSFKAAEDALNPAPVVTLASISATYEGTIAVGGELDAAKLTVTATYSDESTKTVTGTAGTIDTATAGDKQVTITYTEDGVTKECTVTITVVAPQPDHICGHVCETCGKCTNAACTDEVCAEKCKGHEQPGPETWTVSFVNGDTLVATETVNDGATVAKPATDPISESGKTFRYWTDDNGEYDFATPVTEDIMLYASFAWKVTYLAGEGTGTAPESKWITMWTPGSITALPEATDLSNGDKVFAGWSDGTNVYQAGERYTDASNYSGLGNVTFTAIWQDAPDASKYTLTFTVGTQGAGTPPAAIQLAEGETTTLPEGTSLRLSDDYKDSDLTKDYVFLGWSENWRGNPLLLAGSTFTMPAKNVSLQAIWGPASVEPTPEELLENYLGPWVGSLKIAMYTTYDNFILTAEKISFHDNFYAADKGFKDYTFTLSLNDDDNLVLTLNDTFNVTFTSNTACTVVNTSSSYDKTAEFAKATEVTVSYSLGANYAGDSTAPATQNLLAPVKIKAPTTPEWYGYRFLGWFLDDATEQFDFANTNITESCTLTAHWQQITQVTVTFVIPTGVEGYTAPAAQTLAFEGTATEPNAEDFTREGYRFDGWYKSTTTKFDFTTQLTDDITLTAKWSQLFAVTYEYPEVVDKESETSNEASVTLPACPEDLTSAGYEFRGWAVVEDGSTYNGALKAAGETVNIYGNTTITAVYAVRYTGSANIVFVRTDDYITYGNLQSQPNNTKTYTKIEFNDNTTILNINNGSLAVHIDYDAKTITKCTDDMYKYTYTATDGTTLTFDGMGNALLGNTACTYTVTSDSWNRERAITLNFGDDGSYDLETDWYYDIAGTNTITIGETTYTFE